MTRPDQQIADEATADGSIEEHRADYARAGFGGSLPWGSRPAVVVVDVCRAYVDPDSGLYIGSSDAHESIGRLVDAARSNDVPVVFTRVEYEPGGTDGGLFFRKVPALASFVRGNPLGDFTEHPRPLDGEVVVTKQYASAFFGTSLASTLRTMGVDTVVVCGFSTSGCVRATGLDALQHGFVPIVVADACGDRHPDIQAANLFDLGAKYAEIVTEADAVAEFQHRG